MVKDSVKEGRGGEEDDDRLSIPKKIKKS